MKLLLSPADIFSVVIISLLLTLLVYHFFIYFGREGTDRIYYIYFSLFALNFAIYLLCVTGLHRFIFSSIELKQLISPAVTGITYFLLLDYARKMFAIILNFPGSSHKIFRPYFYSFLIYGVLIASYLLIGYEVYIVHIFPWVVVFATFSPVYMFIVFTIHIVRQRTADITQKIILSGFFIFMLDFALEEILSVLHIYYALKGSYFISGLSALLWAFALAIRFNNEYSELQLLKQSLETKVTERTREYEIAIEQRTNTFINLAHEVRTPLTLISNYTDEQIENHGLTREMEIIRENAQKMARDISNFFNEEKFRKGIMIFDHSQIVNFSELLISKSETFRLYARRKNQQLGSNIETGIYIKSDRSALESLLNNLLENAIKYTHHHGKISVSLVSQGKKIILTVHDNGAGIPQEAQEKIFEPFFQVMGKKYNNQGIGMGLYIVHNIVNSLGGKIKLRSRPGEGTVFIVELTRHELVLSEKESQYITSAPVVNAEAYVSDIGNNKKHSVLIVEDNLQMLGYLASRLQEHFSVYVATDGRMALEKLGSINRPDLIISDIMMDNMDGYEFMKELSGKNFNAVPLIFLTAKATEHDKLKGLNLGAVDFIYKPFNIHELISKAVTIVSKAEQQKSELVTSISRFLNGTAEATPSSSGESAFEYNCYRFNISGREKEIIVKMAEGSTYSNIAARLFISKNTVSKHIRNIFQKTGTCNKVELLSRMWKT